MKVRKAVLPVAGLGTRFLPATKAMPKEMLPVVDKPLVQYAVEEAWSAGIEQIIFVTGRGKAALEDHFDRSRDLERILDERNESDRLEQIRQLIPESGTIVYTRQNDPLGLGHAVWCARTLVGEEPFAVLLADDLIPPDAPLLRDMVHHFNRHQSTVVAITTVDRRETNRYGVVIPATEERPFFPIRGLVEKPDPATAPSNLGIIGRYILTPRIFSLLGRGRRGASAEVQLTDAIHDLLATEEVYGLLHSGVRHDCGDRPGFLMANLDLALAREDLRPLLLPFLRRQLDRWEKGSGSSGENSGTP